MYKKYVREREGERERRRGREGGRGFRPNERTFLTRPYLFLLPILWQEVVGMNE